MEKLYISITELVVLAGLVSKKYFYGISDPFFGMTPDEILVASESAKTLLDKKGLISYNFDGTVEITDNGKEIIDRTLEANAYLFFDGLIDGEQQDRVLYYKKASKETLCKYKGMDIDIEESTMENCISVIDKLSFANNTSSKKSDKSFICKIDVLKEISELIEEQKEEMSLGELKELCLKKLSSFNIDSDVKESIVDGLFKNCNYLSLMAGGVKERNLKSTQFVITPNKILCMQTLNNIENEVSFKLVDKDEVKTMINGIMKSLEVS